MALLVVVMLGMPKNVTAGQPAVLPPTGPQSGGVFTGTYTFTTYIYCTSGFSFTSSYSNNLEGTHTFAFYGAADGSLLVRIDGGGLLLVTSCGDPLTPPHTHVTTYTVTKYAAPAPTPSPTATPPTTGSGGGGTGSSTGTSGSSGQGAPAAPSLTSVTPTPAPPAQAPGPTPNPSRRDLPAVVAGSSDASASVAVVPPRTGWSLGWAAVFGVAVLCLMTLGRFGGMRRRLSLKLAFVWLRLEPYWFRLRHHWHHYRPRVYGHELPRRRGLSAHHHSGKVLAHHHTSYAALGFLLLLAAALTAAVSLSTRAESAFMSLTVTGPPPSTAATIDQPLSGEHFTTAGQTVRGTCPAGIGLEVYRNGSFAGSGLCDTGGLYAILITLVPGPNSLVVRVVDALGQYGPDSNTITIYYDPPPPPSPAPTPSPVPTATPTVSPRPSVSASPAPAGPKPLLLDSARHFYQGGMVGEPVEWTVTISGGRRPYRTTWDWGDGQTDTTSAGIATEIKHSHRYAQPGVYRLTIRARDALAGEAILQLVVVVNGEAGTGVAPTRPDPGRLVFVWPLLIAVGIIILSFWLGERHKLATSALVAITPTFPPSGH